MSTTITRSPFFYVGDKYKLMPQIIKHFPSHISRYYEPFVGGGTVFLNLQATHYYLNDLDSHLISLHQCLNSYASRREEFFNHVAEIVEKYNLSKSFLSDVIPQSYRLKYKKTYYARYNQKGYTQLRDYFNLTEPGNPIILYVLLIYGFNRMLRFNRHGHFNIPVGNVDLNQNVVKSLNDYFNFADIHTLIYSNQDYHDFLLTQRYSEDDFVYLDPPYLIAASEYNKTWTAAEEIKFLKTVDTLDKMRVRFALSNVTHYRERKNDILIKWMKKYKTVALSSNYINYHNNSQKHVREVLITNY